MKKLFVGILIMVVALMLGINAYSSDVNYSYNDLGQLHNDNMLHPSIEMSNEYKDVRLIRSEYYTNGKRNRICGPAVEYLSVRYTFEDKSLSVDWRTADVYYQEWWLDGKRYTKAEYDKKLKEMAK